MRDNHVIERRIYGENFMENISRMSVSLGRDKFVRGFYSFVCTGTSEEVMKFILPPSLFTYLFERDFRLYNYKFSLFMKLK